MSSIELYRIKKRIEEAVNILVVSHHDPDGDALGSSLGLSLFLNSIEKKTTVYNRDKCPEYLNFIDSSNLVNSIENISDDFDLILLLDLNDFERTGEDMSIYLKNTQTDIIVIDHHQNPKIKTNFSLIDANSSSTGILIYNLILSFGQPINNLIATLLLTTIITDTSSFRNSNTNSEALRVASELINLGANMQLINSSLLNERSLNKLLLEKEILLNHEFYSDIHTLISFCTTENYKSTNTTKEQSEGIANFLLNHKEVKIGIFIRQISKNSWKVSMRTDGFINLSLLANKFDGGGHKNASGFSFDGNIDYLKKLLRERILYEQQNPTS
ncbi:MAG: bifunctional oligoribonuclease/PAP phosphatase NrnA [bacterium]|nr:bifunctional oligoribonuclease/PAP phosphatase NrnA [bacterium]|tara:strand:+ start:9506 stop:10492 length:987 start_codon:yes stop_codon:yes gene_type:complete